MRWGCPFSILEVIIFSSDMIIEVLNSGDIKFYKIFIGSLNFLKSYNFTVLSFSLVKNLTGFIKWQQPNTIPFLSKSVFSFNTGFLYILLGEKIYIDLNNDNNHSKILTNIHTFDYLTMSTRN